MICRQCGQCGNPNNTAGADEDGNCFECGADHWVEWNDFKESGLTRYIDDVSKNLKLSKSELAMKVYKSSDDNTYIKLNEESRKRRFIKDVLKDFVI